MRTGLEKYFGVRIKPNSPGSHTVTTFLTHRELEQFVVEPWARGRAIVLNSGQFEPNSYTIEIKPYLGVPKVHENVHQLWRTITAADQSARFLNQAAIDRYKEGAPEIAPSEGPTEDKEHARNSGPVIRRWEYLRDHNVWSKVVAQLIYAALIAAGVGIGALALGRISGKQSAADENPAQSAPRDRNETRSLPNSATLKTSCPHVEATDANLVTFGMQGHGPGSPAGRYERTVRASAGDVLTFQLWIQNRERQMALENALAFVDHSSEASTQLVVTGAICGSNFHRRESSVSVESSTPVRLQWLPRSVQVRTKIEDSYRTIGGADSLTDLTKGLALPRLEADERSERGFTTVVIAARVK